MSAGSRIRRFVPLLPLVFMTAVVARYAIVAVYAKVGHPAATLDDAYIHFQYARAFAEGHPFRYQAGEPISTGATSFAWPVILAIPYLVGFHGESIMWPAWILSFAALGALAWETYALAKPLAGRGAAIGAGAMTLFFGGLVWCAASGMEVVPFAWVVATTTRRAAEWFEGPESARTKRKFSWLLALAVLAPLFRPEGAITALVAGAAVLARPYAKKRVLAIAFVAAALCPNLLFLILTGHATSSTAQVKLLFGNPYYAVADTALANARTLVTKILNGEVWSAEFLPTGGAPFACAGLVTIAWRAHSTSRWFRAIAILILALSMFVPCFYVTFLWNRLRYLWPFAPGWFIGLACLGRALGFLFARIDARAAAATSAVVSGGFAGAMVVHLDWVIEDVAQSASGIDRQQATLGRWSEHALPSDARIGVNDTGAIAYFGNHRTFDVVGLTTATEGRYWVAGAASRFEHYERLPRTALPTHFIIYPDWMGTTAVLGRVLNEAVVTDASILGGQTMRAYEARWDYLGSGSKPWTPMTRIDDEVDVADIDSEAEHAYPLLGAREGDETVEEGAAPDGHTVMDGGRANRDRDRFTVRLRKGANARGIARIDAPSGMILRVLHGGEEVARIATDDPGWAEIPFQIPARVIDSDTTTLEIACEGGPFTSFHYWFGE